MFTCRRLFSMYINHLYVRIMERRVSVIQFSERGNPRRYTIQLPDATTDFDHHFLDAIRGRHIRIRPSGVSQAPPNLLDMLRGMTAPTTEAIRDTIPVYTAEGEVAECSICQETIKVGDQFRRLPCGVTINHCFHKDCIDPWLRQNNTCPNCRAKLD